MANCDGSASREASEGVRSALVTGEGVRRLVEMETRRGEGEDVEDVREGGGSHSGVF